MKILAINPWIYDFAAYDLWSKPLGFLYLINILRKSGLEVKFIDCMDRFHPKLLKYTKKFPKTNQWGCGKYYYEIIPKPTVFKNILRKYKRYGLPIEIFEEEIETFEEPELILITSGMTYWYGGVFDAVKILRKHFRKTPIILGGNYATLCSEHAKKFSGADYIYTSPSFSELFKSILNVEIKNYSSFKEFPEPDYATYSYLPYVVLRTSVGCPFRCSYCGVYLLSSHLEFKSPARILEEIEYFHERFSVKNFAFYDDALLYNPNIKPILKKIIKKDLKIFIHSPNGLHAKYITEEVAELLYRTKFISPRISLETIDEERQISTGGKVKTKEFLRAIENLVNAGYETRELIVYLMVGLPGQTYKEVLDSINFLKKLKVKISLSEYSPVPGTKMFPFRNETDPLLTNNTYHTFNFEGIRELKEIVKEYNSLI